jgi:hypothetical protein
LTNKTRPPTAANTGKDSKEVSKDISISHPKKWGERTNSWKPA